LCIHKSPSYGVKMNCGGTDASTIDCQSDNGNASLLTKQLEAWTLIQTPLLADPDSLEFIAHTAYRRADLPVPFPNPTLLARRNGFLLRPVLDRRQCGGAYCDKILHYSPQGNRRQVGSVVYHEFAHGLLVRDGCAHAHGDVNYLALALMAPRATVLSISDQRFHIDEVLRLLIRRQVYALLPSLRLRIQSVWLSEAH